MPVSISIGDIIALVEFANKIRKALSTAVASLEKYHHLYNQLQTDDIILSMMESHLRREAERPDTVPQFGELLAATLMQYWGISERIYGMLGSYSAVKGGGHRMQNTTSVEATSDKIAGHFGPEILVRWRDIQQRLSWAFKGVQKVEEMMRLLSVEMSTLKALSPILQMYVYCDFKLNPYVTSFSYTPRNVSQRIETEQHLLLQYYERMRMDRLPFQRIVIFHDMSGTKVPLPIDFCVDKEARTISTIRLIASLGIRGCTDLTASRPSTVCFASISNVGISL